MQLGYRQSISKLMVIMFCRELLSYKKAIRRKLGTKMQGFAQMGAGKQP